MIKVAVAGYAGRMGSAVVDAVTAADNMNVVCGIDPHAKEAPFPVFGTLAEALDATDVDVLVDFTQPNVVAGNLSVALPRGVDCVVGTTGLSNETLEGLAASAAPGTCLFYAPNFTTGAVLMMEFAKAAAPYFPEAEVIEMHHCNKKDAPSGTAVRNLENSAPSSLRSNFIFLFSFLKVLHAEFSIAFRAHISHPLRVIATLSAQEQGVHFLHRPVLAANGAMFPQPLFLFHCRDFLQKCRRLFPAHILSAHYAFHVAPHKHRRTSCICRCQNVLYPSSLWNNLFGILACFRSNNCPFQLSERFCCIAFKRSEKRLYGYERIILFVCPHAV